MADPDPVVREVAIRALISKNQFDMKLVEEGVVREVVNRLQDPHRSVRAAALALLAQELRLSPATVRNPAIAALQRLARTDESLREEAEDLIEETRQFVETLPAGLR